MSVPRSLHAFLKIQLKSKLPVSKATTVFLLLILIIRVEHDLKRILNGTEALREEIINKIRYIPALRIYSKHAS